MSPLNFARAVITSSFKKKRQKSKITATGGTTSTPGNGYRIHTFSSPGTFTIVSGYDDVEYLLVGGGGGGESGDNAGSSGGGAGAGGGGVLTGSILLSEGNYPLVVGLGGTGAIARTTPLFFKVSGNFGDPSPLPPPPPEPYTTETPEKFVVIPIPPHAVSPPGG